MATGPDRRSVVSWVVYDLANTIFALGVLGVFFAEYLLSIGRSETELTLVVVGAAAVVIFVAPWAGARSDVSGKRVPTLMATTLIAVTATALLATGPLALSLALLWVAIIAVNTGSVVYDALLVDVSTPGNRGWVSGLGVGVGYLGSFIAVGIGAVTLSVLDWGYEGTFRAIAAGFLLFALPSFFFIREQERPVSGPAPGIGDLIRRIVDSWRLARSYRGVTRFLVGRFLYTDAINTLITGYLAFFVIDELGLDRVLFEGLLVTAIASAIVGGLVAGRYVERFGPLRVLRGVLVAWVLALSSGIASALTSVTWLVWVIGPIGGMALGATWAADRVVMTRISPPRYLGEFYGLYATVARFATIFGPITWWFIVDIAGLSRTFAVGALAVFIAVSWWVLREVDDSPRAWGSDDRLVVSESPEPSPT
ncbi:MAG: MFS transporter [Acidimicrobiia bacterium]|nr:MFS transporter [Acidimicrobiia bacterium]